MEEGCITFYLFSLLYVIGFMLIQRYCNKGLSDYEAVIFGTAISVCPWHGRVISRGCIFYGAGWSASCSPSCWLQHVSGAIHHHHVFSSLRASARIREQDALSTSALCTPLVCLVDSPVKRLVSRWTATCLSGVLHFPSSHCGAKTPVVSLFYQGRGHR